MIYLVTGGQRSGKSNYAENLALSLSANPVYLATSRILDEDFRKRVLIHQSGRSDKWENIEEEKYISRYNFSKRTVVVDCLTLWIANFYYDYNEDLAEAQRAILEELNKVDHHDTTFIYVTNEIGMGLHGTTASTRRFTDLQGWINQEIAKRADSVIFIVSGLPLKLK